MSDKYAVPNKLPGKTVSVLTHRKRRILHQDAASNSKVLIQKRQIAKQKANKKTFRRAESFIMSHIKAERTEKRTKHILLRTNFTKAKKDQLGANQKLLVVMRHAGKKVFNPTADSILKSLRLGRRQNCVFLENTKENQILLQIIEPFVVYGSPSISSIRELIFKKGFANIAGKKTPIQSNTLIEEHLGEKAIICLEDIIHEIYTVGANFDTVNRFLCPFLLSAPRDGWKNKVSVPAKRGGEYGYRGKDINDIIARCL